MFLCALTVHAQSTDAVGDPKRVLVVVEDAGSVGLRISDAQSLHEAVLTNLRKRLGNDAVVYEGTRKNAEKMKKMLGKTAETQVQDAQLAFFDEAMKNASWRVNAKFGQKKNEHFIRLQCRKTEQKTILDDKVYTGKNFLAAKDAMDKDLDSFCQVLPVTATLIPVEGAPQPKKPGEIEGLRKKELKPWSPPPRRE